MKTVTEYDYQQQILSDQAQYHENAVTLKFSDTK